MSEKKSFLDAIKEALSKKNRSNLPETESKEIQQAKYGNKPAVNKPMKKSSGRGR
jgi:hypothetical protein